MKILYLNRAKSFGGFSFEELFKTIKSNLTGCEIEDFYDKTFSSFWKNNQAIRKIKCDVIHITGGIGYYALFLPKKKTILTIHDTNHYEFDLKGFRKWIYGWLIYRLPIMNVKYVTVVSNHTKNNLIRFFGIDETKIKVIPNCFPLEFKENKKEFLSKPTKILQIGTKPNKNLKRLIEAIYQLNVELTIIGKLTHEIIELLKKNEINYVNKSNLTINEIYQAYLDCDIVTFISLREGFGMPIIEANVIGRAIISSNISSMPEVAGISAHLVNPLNTIEIRNGLIKLMEDDDYRRNLIINGLENAKRYNPILISKLYGDLYSEIIKIN
jgi:glycosyltransferase involved in cell wall biosynthesis